ncbi:unnamed protein product [Caenorhabditis bovis]|uniref:ShKT domain-containing protein n=1 Tax=Caenorhabditis bovis TaxID=2654633 RepID=A0A8S1EAN5_9PELO|nr:unnamed protein product [Caenorhabditis bovis]
MKLLALLSFLALVGIAYSQCCRGYPVGACVNSMCPNGTMCTNGYCCPGCYDTCTNCYQYTNLCNNPYYSCTMSCCQATCGKCHP